MIKMQKMMNAEVAEILGAFTGDGWIESRGGALYICGHSVDDKEYYDAYLGPLFSKYFVDVEPKHFSYWHVYGVVTYKKDVIKKALDFGFQIGKKCYTATIPEWVKNSNMSFQKAFLRGLFDTDGSVWVEYSKVNKVPQYRISIVSCSHKLIEECGGILEKLNICFEIKSRLNMSRTRNNAPYFVLRIRRKRDLDKWIENIGTNNPKHAKKFLNIVTTLQ